MAVDELVRNIDTAGATNDSPDRARWLALWTHSHSENPAIEIRTVGTMD